MLNSPSNDASIFRSGDIVVRRGSNELALPGMTIVRGDRIGLVGPNGSGKSTLCLVVAGLLKRPVGVEHSDSLRRLKLGFMPQHGGLYLGSTVAENIAFFRRIYSCHGEFDPRLFPVLRTLGLDRVLDTRVSTLSGGYLRLACLASVLCIEAEGLILDEPMAGLDDEYRDAAQRAIAIAADNAAFLIATGHRRDDVQFCRTIVVVGTARR